MDNASTVILGMNPDELRGMFHSIMETINSNNPKREEIKYLSRGEVCNLLKISYPTLHEYIKKGILKGNKIGRRVLFIEKDVLNAVQEMPSIKYKRKQ